MEALLFVSLDVFDLPKDLKEDLSQIPVLVLSHVLIIAHMYN